MPNVLSYTNAFPGIAFPQHLSGQTTTVQSYIYPGAVQPNPNVTLVLSYTNAFPGIAFPQHLSGQTAAVQSYLYPGAVQPPPVVSGGFMVFNRQTLSAQQLTTIMATLRLT